MTRPIEQKGLGVIGIALVRTGERGIVVSTGPQNIVSVRFDGRRYPITVSASDVLREGA